MRISQGRGAKGLSGSKTPAYLLLCGFVLACFCSASSVTKYLEQEMQ